MGIGGEDSQSDSGVSTGEFAKRMIDLKDCLQDSPHFRSQLSDHEREINDLESRLEKVVQHCDRMVASGHTFTEACRGFSTSLKELSTHFKEDKVVSTSLKRFYDILTELQSYYSILFDQAQRSVQRALRGFLSGELKKVKDMKKAFHKTSDEFYSAIHRNAHAPKNRPLEADEASLQLANMQTQFSHQAIDYGYQINTIGCIKGHAIIDNLISFMHSQFTFFHQGYDLLKEFDPFMRQVSVEVDRMRKESEAAVTDMNCRHSLVTPQHLQDGSPDEPLNPMDNPSAPIEMSGYLFKRGSNAFKSWSRRWFILSDNRLVYVTKKEEEGVVTVAEDLRICTVKYTEELERRFCFEVVTPVRYCMLQADSEALRKKWCTYLEAGIARALRISASNKKKEEVQNFRKRSATVTSQGSPQPEDRESPAFRSRCGTATSNYSLGIDFLDIPGNRKCADCSSKSPKWASINLGIMLCIECSGIHRSLGVHISKVRSVTLDDWEPEIQKIMCALGNARVNAIYEYEIPEHVKKPTASSSRSEREFFIKAKYVQHAFVHPHPNFERPEIPLPRPTFPQLLNPSRSPQQKRSLSLQIKRPFSPQLKLRSPKQRVTRPASFAAGFDAVSNKSFDSDDESTSLLHSEITEEMNKKETSKEMLTEDRSSSVATGSVSSSSLALLAENFKKLEKSGKLKSWGGKIKAGASRASFSLGKFSKSQSALYKGLAKLRRDSPKSSPKTQRKRPDQEVHSDNDSDSLGAASSTPLLHSETASVATPPPKPPRTFTTKTLDVGPNAVECPWDINSPSPHPPSPLCDDFSGNVLSAIGEMGRIYSQTEGSVAEVSSETAERKDETEKLVANGRVTMGVLATGTAESGSDNSQKTPLASPAHSQVQLQADKMERKTAAEHSQVLSSVSKSDAAGDSAIVFQVTMATPPTSLKGSARGSLDELSKDEEWSEALMEVEADERQEDEDAETPLIPRKLRREGRDELGALRTHVALPCPGNAGTKDVDKRMSIMSVASTEWFSASSSSDSESLDDFVSSPSQIELEEGNDLPARTPSSTSEVYNTPPSSPHIDIDRFCSTPEPTNQAGGDDHVTGGLQELRSQDDPQQPAERTEEANHVSSNTVSDIAIRESGDGSEGPIEQPLEFVDAVTDRSHSESPADRKPDTEVAEIRPSTEEQERAEADDEGDEEFQDVFEIPPLRLRSHKKHSSTSTGSASGGRKRSLTTTDINLEKLEARDTLGELYSNVSKDDNFDTECKRHHYRSQALSVSTSGMISSFSAQDFAEILGPSLPTLLVDSPERDVEDESSEMERSGRMAIGSVDGLNDADCSSAGDEGGKMTPNSLASGTTSPDIVEPVIIPDAITPDSYMYNCSLIGDLPGILCALVHGGNINYANEEEDSKRPVMLAIESGNSVAIEFLYQNGAKLHVKDSRGRGCLHFAALSEDAGIVVLLLKRGAKVGSVDEEGKDPIDIALERENGDIVTLLRVAKMKAEQRKDHRHSQVLEDTVAEVYKDFEVAALVDPDRMKRRSLIGSSDSASIGSRESTQH